MVKRQIFSACFRYILLSIETDCELGVPWLLRLQKQFIIIILKQFLKTFENICSDSVAQEEAEAFTPVKGEWRRYPASETKFFLRKIDRSPSISSDDSRPSSPEIGKIASKIFPMSNVSQQDFTVEKDENSASSRVNERLKNVKQIKKQRIGPVHSDISSALPNTQDESFVFKQPRKCRSETSTVKTGLLEIQISDKAKRGKQVSQCFQYLNKLTKNIMRVIVPTKIGTNRLYQLKYLQVSKSFTIL